MELFTQLLNALWAQDYETLANPSMIGMLYFERRSSDHNLIKILSPYMPRAQTCR